VGTLDMTLAVIAAIVAVAAVVSLLSLMFGPWALAWVPQ
jgi:hypothetical protein